MRTLVIPVQKAAIVLVILASFVVEKLFPWGVEIKY